MDLASGQHLEINFTLSTRPAFTVTGKVVTSGAWKQVDPPMIVDKLEQPLFKPDRFDAQSGEFEFLAVPTGSYRMSVRVTDMEGHPASRQQTVVITRATSNLKLLLKPGAEIPVVIRTEFSKPPRGRCSTTSASGEQSQSDCSDYPPARVELRSAEDFQASFSTGFGPVKDPYAMTITNVTPGKYLVRARAYFGGYVQSLRCGDADLFREELVVPESGVVPPIEVVMRDDAATVNVKVRGDKPVQQAAVLIVPDDEMFREPRIMAAGGAMEVQAIYLAPGAYKVFAFDSIADLDYEEPGTLAKYAGKAASLTLSANGTASVTVDLIHRGE